MNTLTKVALTATLVTGAALPAMAAETAAASTPAATAAAGDRLEGLVEISRISTGSLYGFLPAPSTSDANLRLVDWKRAGTWTTPTVGVAGEFRSEGLCLTASKATEAAAVTAEACDGSAQQQWTISADGYLSSAEWGGSSFTKRLSNYWLQPSAKPEMKIETGLLSRVGA